jgi:hypothetical protein
MSRSVISELQTLKDLLFCGRWNSSHCRVWVWQTISMNRTKIRWLTSSTWSQYRISPIPRKICDLEDANCAGPAARHGLPTRLILQVCRKHQMHKISPTSTFSLSAEYSNVISFWMCHYISDLKEEYLPTANEDEATSHLLLSLPSCIYICTHLSRWCIHCRVKARRG